MKKAEPFFFGVLQPFLTIDRKAIRAVPTREYTSKYSAVRRLKFPSCRTH